MTPNPTQITNEAISLDPAFQTDLPDYPVTIYALPPADLMDDYERAQYWRWVDGEAA